MFPQIRLKLEALEARRMPSALTVPLDSTASAIAALNSEPEQKPASPAPALGNDPTVEQGLGYQYSVGPTGVELLPLDSMPLRMNLVGANPAAPAIESGLGADQKAGFKNVWSGIDDDFSENAARCVRF